MKIDVLIERILEMSENAMNTYQKVTLERAAETIKLLWEVARENRLEQYRMLIDEMRDDENG